MAEERPALPGILRTLLERLFKHRMEMDVSIEIKLGGRTLLAFDIKGHRTTRPVE